MADDSPSRSLDRIMIRLPNGMRDRLASRAKASGRSVNAEVVAMLEDAMDGAGFETAKLYVDELQRLNRQHRALAAVLRETRDRRTAVLEQLRLVASQDLAEGVPDEIRDAARKLFDRIDSIMEISQSRLTKAGDSQDQS